MHFAFFLALGFGFLQPVELPSCGVASTYVVVRNYRQDVTYQDFVERCRSILNRRALDTLSINDLVAVLNAYDLNYQGVRYDPAHCALASLPLFSICYIPPEKLHVRLGNDVGHFLVYVGCEDGTVKCLDFSGGNSSLSYFPEDEFRNKWNGVAVIGASVSPYWSIAAVLIAVIAAVAVLRKWQWGRSPVLLLLVSILSILGCSNSPAGHHHSSAEHYPLTIAEGYDQFVDAETDSTKVILPVRLVAWSNTDVLIKGVRTSCSCGNFDRPVAGVRLTRGTTTEFRLTINSENIKGYKGVVVYFDYELPGQKNLRTVPLTVHTVFTESVPSFVAQKITFELPYQSDKAVNFSFVHYRPKGTEPFRIEAVKDRDSVLDLVTSECKSYIYYNKNNRTVYEDRFTVMLKNKPNQAIGQYASLLNVHLSDGRRGTTIEVPCVYSVIHPCAPSVPRIFSGRLSPGQEWRYLVHFRRNGDHRIAVKGVTSNDPAIVPDLTAEGALAVTVKAREGGLHSGVITVTYSDEQIPPTMLTVDYLIGTP